MLEVEHRRPSGTVYWNEIRARNPRALWAAARDQPDHNREIERVEGHPTRGEPQERGGPTTGSGHGGVDSGQPKAVMTKPSSTRAHTQRRKRPE